MVHLHVWVLIGPERTAYHNIFKGEPGPETNAIRASAITVTPLNDKAPDGINFVVGWTGERPAG